jgi:hypothetical protein
MNEILTIHDLPRRLRPAIAACAIAAGFSLSRHPAGMYDLG